MIKIKSERDMLEAHVLNARYH